MEIVHKIDNKLQDIRILHRLTRPLDLTFSYEVALIDCYTISNPGFNVARRPRTIGPSIALPISLSTPSISNANSSDQRRLFSMHCDILEIPQQIPTISCARKLLRHLMLPNSLPLGLPLYLPAVKAKVQTISIEINPMIETSNKVTIPGLEEEAPEDEEDDNRFFCFKDNMLVILLHFRPVIKPSCFICHPLAVS